MQDMVHWVERAPPQRRVFDGHYVRLEPLENHHGDDLFHASCQPGEQEKFRYLADEPPQTRAEFDVFITQACTSTDPLFFAVIDKGSGRVGGRQALLRCDPKMGVIEIGHIYWGPQIRNRRQATEAQFLLADYIFTQLGYRRYEWKCDDNNIASKNAALRFGFVYEGLFRQHRIVKGKNRDTAWFAMIDSDWPPLRQAYLEWLHPDNFNEQGQQKKRLSDLISNIKLRRYSERT